MPFVQGICPNCGGTLAVDNEKDAAVCLYCNTPFIVEKAINEFNIKHVDNINFDKVENVNVNISGKDGIEERCKACRIYIGNGNFIEASKINDDIIHDYPSDYRGYWYKVLIATNNFKTEPYVYRNGMYANCNNIIPGVRQSFNMACTLIDNSDPDELENMKRQYLNYEKRYLDELKLRKDNMQKLICEEKEKNDSKVGIGILVTIAIWVFIILYIFR